MDIVIKTKNKDTINERISIPVRSSVKNKLAIMKVKYEIDINDFLRDCLDEYIKKFESEKNLSF